MAVSFERENEAWPIWVGFGGGRKSEFYERTDSLGFKEYGVYVSSSQLKEIRDQIDEVLQENHHAE